jgi:hypothetical protein
MAEAVRHRAVIAEARVRSVVSACGFVIEKVVLGQAFIPVLSSLPVSTVMRRLTTGIRSGKYVVRRFRLCANVI